MDFIDNLCIQLEVWFYLKSALFAQGVINWGFDAARVVDVGLGVGVAVGKLVLV
jgi:hypothetical protein